GGAASSTRRVAIDRVEAGAEDTDDVAGTRTTRMDCVEERRTGAGSRRNTEQGRRADRRDIVRRDGSEVAIAPGAAVLPLLSNRRHARDRSIDPEVAAPVEVEIRREGVQPRRRVGAELYVGNLVIRELSDAEADSLRRGPRIASALRDAGGIDGTVR